MSLEKNARVTWTLDGRNMGVAMVKSGGKVDSQEKKIRSGGGEPEESLGGVATRDNITLEILQRNTSLANIRFAESKCGKGDKARVNVIEQPLDADEFADGEPEAFPGTLKSVERSKRDVMSGDESKWTVEITAVVGA